MGLQLVAVGASAGGLRALQLLLASLPADWNVPVAIVQHRSRESDALRELLQDVTELPVCEVEDKVELEPGMVYVAPPDYHTLLDGRHFSLSVDAPVRFSRPSIDVLFESAADIFGPGAVGVVLTGANADGSRGLARIVAAGGAGLVQDPGEAEVATMPWAAIRAVPTACVLPLSGMGEHLLKLRTMRPNQALSSGCGGQQAA